MKTIVCALLIVGLGVGLGFLRTAEEFGWTIGRPALAGTQQLSSRAGSAKVVVPQEVFAFGRMQQNETGTHVFVLRNEGLADLKITPGKPSCKCTVSKVSRKTIPPGETAEVTLTWKTGKSKGKYRKRAPISTNDPSQPKLHLRIEGTVTPDFAFRPPTLFASSLATDTEREFEAELFFYGKQKVQLLGQELTNLKAAPYFDIGYRPIAEEKLKEPYALSGYRITVKIRPGMAVGNFHEAVIFQTEPAMVRPVRLNVNGSVREPVSLFGPHFDKQTQTLNMGTVGEGRGKQMRLLMHAAGAHRNQIKPTLVRSEPPGITLKVGPSALLAKGTLRQFSLIFTLPKDTEPGNYGAGTKPEGQIVIATGHPDYPEIVLHVKLQVEPRNVTPQDDGKTATDAAEPSADAPK